MLFRSLLAAAVSSVDQEMTIIRDSGKVKARERIAVLTALNLAYQMAERGPVAQQPNDPGAGRDVDLEALIRRVDAALGDDGQLLWLAACAHQHTHAQARSRMKLSAVSL